MSSPDGHGHQIIVAGHLVVLPDDRDTYLATCVEVVASARSAPGCLDFSVSADIVDPGRINVYERWSDDASLHAFRQGGPDDGQMDLLREISVAEFSVRP